MAIFPVFFATPTLVIVPLVLITEIFWAFIGIDDEPRWLEPKAEEVTAEAASGTPSGEKGRRSA